MQQLAESPELVNNPLPSPSLSEWLLWLARRRRRFVVHGNSMAPLLLDSDVVFVDVQAYVSSLPQTGDVVVAPHPYQRDLQLIKRVAAVTDDQRAFLRSDNPAEGTDSRSFGAVPCQLILGQVTARISV